jgi:hypothetical protein
MVSGVVGDVKQNIVLRMLMQLEKGAKVQSNAPNVVRAHSVLLNFARTVGKEMN